MNDEMSFRIEPVVKGQWGLGVFRVEGDTPKERELWLCAFRRAIVIAWTVA